MPFLNLIITGVISVDDNIRYGNCSSFPKTQVLSMVELAEIAGLATGVVTTARLTHATPSTAYAHSPARGWEDDSKTPSPCRDIGK